MACRAATPAARARAPRPLRGPLRRPPAQPGRRPAGRCGAEAGPSPGPSTAPAPAPDGVDAASLGVLAAVAAGRRDAAGKGALHEAMRALRAGPTAGPGLELAEVLGPAGGSLWNLVYTVPTKADIAANKGEPCPGGSFFPIRACQQFDCEAGTIKNGVYLGGHVFSLVFSGPMDLQKNILRFDFDRLTITLGPWRFGFDVGAKGEFAKAVAKDATAAKPLKDYPFFLTYFADDKIWVAKGKGGGLAMWRRVSPAWALENGVV